MRDNNAIYDIGDWFRRDFCNRMADLGSDLERNAEWDNDACYLMEALDHMEKWLEQARKHVNTVREMAKDEAV